MSENNVRPGSGYARGSGSMQYHPKSPPRQQQQAQPLWGRPARASLEDLIEPSERMELHSRLDIGPHGIEMALQRQTSNGDVAPGLPRDNRNTPDIDGLRPSMPSRPATDRKNTLRPYVATRPSDRDYGVNSNSRLSSGTHTEHIRQSSFDATKSSSSDRDYGVISNSPHSSGTNTEHIRQSSYDATKFSSSDRDYGVNSNYPHSSGTHTEHIRQSSFDATKSSSSDRDYGVNSNSHNSSGTHTEYLRQSSYDATRSSSSDRDYGVNFNSPRSSGTNTERMRQRSHDPTTSSSNEFFRRSGGTARPAMPEQRGHMRHYSHDEQQHGMHHRFPSRGAGQLSESHPVHGGALLGTHLPDGWSCPPNGSLPLLLQGRVRLSKVQDEAAMVMANKPIPINLLTQVGVAENVGPRTEAPNLGRSVSAPSSSCMVYYFEVTLESDRVMWIGLVDANHVHKSESLKHPYHVARNRFPGDSPGSIGLSSEGTLLLGGFPVQGGLGAFGSFVSGDTLGCGFEILGLRRVFFTKNGALLGSPKRFEEFQIIDKSRLLPAVTLSEGVISATGNFGLESLRPLKWQGEDRLRLVSPGELLPSDQADAQQEETFEPNHSDTDVGGVASASPSSSASSMRPVLVRDVSILPGAVCEPGPPPATKSLTNFEYLSPDDIDRDKNLVAELTALCAEENRANEVSPLLRKCKDRVKKLTKIIEDLTKLFEDKPMVPENERELNAALDLSVELGRAESTGDEYMARNSAVESSSEQKKPYSPGIKKAISRTILALSEKGDVFSLICMLRAHSREQRLDAALALMTFANGSAPGVSEEEARRLRGEIVSTGGMPSLVGLFRDPSGPVELKVASAMTVAHLAPTYISTNDFAALSSLGTGLSIIDCLHFLSTATDVSPRLNVTITEEDMREAATVAAADFWMNSVIPAMSRQERDAKLGGRKDVSQLAVSERARGRNLHIGNNTEWQEAPGVTVLIESTVSLIVRLSSTFDTSGHALGSQYPLIEAVCGVEAARPIAVREGLLKVLVCWLNSNDQEKIAPAATSLRFLTSTQDKYMAGWIHSQLVNEKAMNKIVQILGNWYVGHRVRLAVAEILCSLCVAPHTRAALVNAKCTNYLVQAVHDHNEEDSVDIVLAATKSLVQLAAGDISRAGIYGEGENVVSNEGLPSNNTDDVISDIINLSAIPSFVSMAESRSRGPLRLACIQAMHVISEDLHPVRNARLHLCRNNAAKALAVVLCKDVEDLDDTRNLVTSREPRNEGSLVSTELDVRIELYHALAALANILEPVVSDAVAFPKFASRSFKSNSEILEGCAEATENGAIDSILRIASLPDSSFVFQRTDSIENVDLLIESVRSLSSVSPLLLSERLSKFAWYTCGILKALACVLKRTIDTEKEGSMELIQGLQLDVWRGIASLAELEPLKLMIVDGSLQHLLQTKQSRGDQAGVPNLPYQICQVLGFSEDELAVQVAGSDPTVLGDWFCLRRSLLIQSMAREEIRRTLIEIWSEPAGRVRRINRGLSLGSTDEERLSEFFEGFEHDGATATMRAKILNDYGRVFDTGGTCAITNDPSGLLSRHSYPLNSVATEREWILGHKHAIEKKGRLLPHQSSSPVGERVEALLDCCLPSRLLQKQILPVGDLRPDSSLNFCSLLMPERRYFSFRREGQILPLLIDKHSAATDSAECFWALGFKNSSFAGEFTETLVQALYRCPDIQSLSFSRSPGSAPADAENDEDGSVLLANLFGSLPPWISSLTFDNIVSDKFIKALIEIIDMMGKLPASERNSDSPTTEDPNLGQKQGTFRSLSFRNSHELGTTGFDPFLELLCSYQFRPALSHLQSLDISGNRLGDEACAVILDLAHSRNSGCILEELDISNNSIRDGVHVIKVLRKYVDTHRRNQTRGMEPEANSWCSPLQVLNVSSNRLCDGELASTLILLLRNSALKLRSLDLSDNGLADDMKNGVHERFSDAFCDSLAKNSSLTELDMSGNRFSRFFLNESLDRLSQSVSHAGVPFLRFDKNTPPLSATQWSKLDGYVLLSRQAALEKNLKERESSESSATIAKPAPAEVPPAVDETNRDSVSWRPDTKQPDNMSTGTASTAQSDWRKPNENKITVLFSAPLVYHNQSGPQPFAKLDFVMERELMWQCLKQAKRDIDLAFDNATSDRLVAAMAVAKNNGCLHFSGHGHSNALPLENGRGGTQWVKVEELRETLSSRGAPFKFVFVSACHSFLAGKTFADAGVPHVVCCQQDSELKDASALTFTRQFYLALAVGRTVRDSFEFGRQAVSVSPNVKNASEEMKKFVLLPEGGDHDVPVFNARPLNEWPRVDSLRMGSKSRRRHLSRSRSSYFAGGARSSELSVRNMIQDDPSPTPPQFFLGREVDMYKVLGNVLEKRLVSVIAPAGYGTSSLACALCHYINERRNTITPIQKIFFVAAKRTGRSKRRPSLLSPLLKKLARTESFTLPSPDADEDVVFERIYRCLKPIKALVVFDGMELLEGTEEAQAFPRFLSGLFQNTKENVKVLLTGSKPLGIRTLGGVGDHRCALGPLSFGNTVRLFTQLCPNLHTVREREDLFKKIVTDMQQEPLCPADDEMDERTGRFFELLGMGVPRQIEHAAYENYKELVEEMKEGKESS